MKIKTRRTILITIGWILFFAAFIIIGGIDSSVSIGKSFLGIIICLIGSLVCFYRAEFLKSYYTYY